MYRNAVYWFTLLLLIDVAGFWPSYFSRLGEAEFHHHAHSVPMLLWVVLLIVQSALIRSGNRSWHRTLGWSSLLLAPLVFVTAIHVTGVDITERDLPYRPHDVGIFWFGLFLAFAFAVFYTQAIRHRKKLALHQRWMAATALVFLIPGLGRLNEHLRRGFDLPLPDFVQTMWIPLVFAGVLVFREWRAGKVFNPWPVFMVLWAINLVAFHNLYRVDAFRAFAQWMARTWGALT